MSGYKLRIKEKYEKEVIPSLKGQFKYKSSMQVPRLKKICINQGIGDFMNEKKLVETFTEEMTNISGQKAVVTKSRIAISNFKLRENQAVGIRVTLRGTKMYEFFDRLVSVALPRVRDFKGVNEKSFDGRGNYTLGVTEQIIFPEIDIDKVAKITGMDITFVTSAKSDKEAYSLLSELGIPFKDKKFIQ